MKYSLNNGHLNNIIIWILGVHSINFFGKNYIEIDVIHGKIQFAESIFDVIDAKIFFMGLTLDVFSWY